MSLLTNPPHTVVVTPKIPQDNGYGGVEYVDGDPVTVRCGVQPVSAEESEALGTSAQTSYRAIGLTWPGGVHSTVEWNGRVFDQQGEARRYSMSPRTAHVDVILTARSAEVK